MGTSFAPLKYESVKRRTQKFSVLTSGERSAGFHPKLSALDLTRVVLQWLKIWCHMPIRSSFASIEAKILLRVGKLPSTKIKRLFLLGLFHQHRNSFTIFGNLGCLAQKMHGEYSMIYSFGISSQPKAAPFCCFSNWNFESRNLPTPAFWNTNWKLKPPQLLPFEPLIESWHQACLIWRIFQFCRNIFLESGEPQNVCLFV